MSSVLNSNDPENQAGSQTDQFAIKFDPDSLYQKYMNAHGKVTYYDPILISHNWSEFSTLGFQMSDQEDGNFSWYIFVAKLLADSLSETYNTLQNLTLQLGDGDIVCKIELLS